MSEPTVLVTGIAGNLGRALAKRLHRDARVVGVDRRPFPDRPKDVEHHEVDVRKRKVEDLFRAGVDAVIHLGIQHDPALSDEDRHSFNVLGTTRVLECVARYGVKKLVVLSSANVYGPSPDNSNFLTEEAPLLAARRFASVRDLIEVDMLASSFLWKTPSTHTVVLRPVHILGPTIRNAPSNYLRMSRPWVLAGFDPMVQFIHMDDVCAAMARALEPGCRGVYNVVGPGEVPLSQAFATLGSRPVPVPHLVARPLLGALFRNRLTRYPPEELDHVQFLCMVDGSRWRDDTGWVPSFTMKDTIRSVMP